MSPEAALQVKPVGERTLVMTRAFAAERALVFEALTRPELVRRWLLGPPGWSMPVCEIDLKVGGSWHYVWRNDDGREFSMDGEYREIVPPERLVYTERFEGWEALVTSTLNENGSRTRLEVVMLFVSSQARDRAIESGMADGAATSYDRLEEILRRQP